MRVGSSITRRTHVASCAAACIHAGILAALPIVFSARDAAAQAGARPSAPAGLRIQTGQTPAPTPAAPWTVTRHLPGTIQAEDFDAGANGVAYSDSTPGNTGAQYRTTDVDIQACSEGGYNIGWSVAGEWLNYTVSVRTSGTYNLDFRVASAVGGTLRAAFNGRDETGAVIIPATGGWQTWTTVRATASLSAGSQVMRVVFDTGNVNLHAIAVSAVPAASGPFGGTAWTLPGTVESENFDLGGAGVAYFDTTPGNTGGAYRSTDVDIQATAGGHAVGWTSAGEWLRYTVSVAAAGNYRLVARVASAGLGGTFHVEFNGVNRTGTLQVPNTGAWTTYQDVTATVSLAAGVQPMRLVFDSHGATGAVGNFTSVRVEAASSEPPPSPAPGGRLRVATWNVNFGAGNFAGQAQEIANIGADVVLLQEASTSVEDMPRTYPERLRQITGHTWYSAWAPHGGRYGPYEGTLILSRLPLADTSTMNAYDRGFARVLVSVGGVQVNLFSIHLDWYDTSARSAQLQEFMAWSRGFAGPRIAGGDFNAWWGQWWITHMETEHTDTWQDVTGSDQNGYTLNGTVRFDYLFRAHAESWRLTPTACWVHATTLSDHRPVVADYLVQ